MGERIRRKSLVNQLQDALTDAEVLQHQKDKRGEESYISQCKLVSNRISALQKLISRKENAGLAELKAENEKLKQANAALKLEVETLKAQPQPVEPVAPTPDAIAIKQSQDEIATTLERMRRGEGSGLSTDAAMAKQGEPQVAPSVLPAISGIPEHMLSKPLTLSPPRVAETLALPRPVVTQAETEKQAIAAMGSEFSNSTEANAKKIQDEWRRKAPKPLF